MNKETTKLLDKARHAIHAAEVLLKDGEKEFAAGRAYYAMFYVAKALLCGKGLRVYTKHTAIHRAYGEYFAKTAELDTKFHRWLIDAFNRRLLGDYDVDANFSSEDVKEAIGQAREFLETATAHLLKHGSAANS
ncbi:MAG: HEPN domain-containing protein [Candidatus Omnitrophica bacterium]|nr:HEPN domain-containing protein [Candidatus Omnitrophota bacterium]